MPHDSTFDVVATIEGLEHGQETRLEILSDLVIVCCNGYSDGVVHLIADAARQQPTG